MMENKTMTTLKESIDTITDVLESGNFENADEMCTTSLIEFPKDINLMELQRRIHNELTMKHFPGNDYLKWLEWFHVNIQPANYVEIGVESGRSLQFAKTPTRVVGIDPEPKIVHGFESWTKIFKQESDTFFKENNLRSVFGNSTVNMAFIDGLHHYDQALKDFMNIELYSEHKTVILFHDVYPAVPATATRAWNTTYWAGDTWKVMTILRKHRPDLKMFTIPTFPTGLGVITNLNPRFSILNSKFDDLVKEAENIDFSDYTPVNVIDNNFDTAANLLGLKNYVK